MALLVTPEEKLGAFSVARCATPETGGNAVAGAETDVNVEVAADADVLVLDSEWGVPKSCTRLFKRRDASANRLSR